MKLVMVTTYATPTNMRRELLEAVLARGHEVTVVSPESADSMQEALSRIGAKYRPWRIDRTAMNPAADVRSASELYSILRFERPDVLLAYQIKAVLLAPVVAKLARVRHVVALVNGLGAVFDEEGFGRSWQASIARRAYGLALRAVDTVAFQNADDPLLLRRMGLIAADANWCVVPGSGVDLTKLTQQPPHLDPPTFTLVSRLLISKGVRDFVTAARQIRARHPGTRFRLVGQLEAEGHPDGITCAELDGWVREGLVEYLGFSQDIVGVLSTTSVFVLPSYYREGVPRTNLEALALARPVVTTDSVGCRDTVENGVNGFLVSPRDPNTLSERLERYLREPDLVRQHGSNSRELAERRFDVRKVNELMIDALRLR